MVRERQNETERRIPHLQWHSVDFVYPAGDSIPAASGLYAVMKVLRCARLPYQIESIYIGQSKNLRRRFLNHKDIWTEHNRRLRDRFNEKNLEFWYALADAHVLNDIERYLIRSIQPSDNDRLKDER